MGAGIAKMIKQTFPEAFEVDQSTKPGDSSKLGTISVASCKRGPITISVVNAYTQLHPSGSGILVDYDALRRAFREVKKRFPGKRIGYPKIGAGLARGAWSVIADIIEEELAGEDHNLVEYAP